MKRLRGEITVFLSLMLVVLLTLFQVLSEGVRVRNAKADGERALNLAMSSTFCEYYKPLWEEYHLFGMSATNLEERLKGYMVLNKGLSLKELSVDEIVWGTDYEGMIFLHQVEAYETYRLPKLLLDKKFSEDFTGQASQVTEPVADSEEENTTDLEKEEEGKAERKKLKKLKGFWGKVMLDMVIDDRSALSKKTVDNPPSSTGGGYDLSSTSPKQNLDKVSRLLKEQKAEIYELAYYLEHFKSYRKTEISFQKKESALDYELEFLLEGKDSDGDNLEAYVKRIILTRTSLNYLSILQDAQKRQAAYELATAALGVTGIPALVVAAQQFILLGWSYEEALVDARVLLEGGKVSLWKEKSEFSISFPEIFVCTKSLIKEKAKARLSKAARAALDYEGYLSLFLSFKKDVKRRQDAWYLINKNMQLRYDKGFSLEDTVFGLQVSASYELPGRLGRDWRFLSERHYSY
jgi:hypothetical protein